MSTVRVDAGTLVVPPFECAWLTGNDYALRNGRGCVQFEARAENDVTLLLKATPGARRQQPLQRQGELTTANASLEPNYTVILGSHRNSCVKIEKTGVTVAMVHNVPAARVNGKNFLKFWVDYNHGVITIGTSEPSLDTVSLRWQDPDPIPNIQHIGLSGWDRHVGYRNITVSPAINFAFSSGTADPSLSMVPSLFKLCMQVVVETLSPSNVCHAAAVAELLLPTTQPLYRTCLDVMARNFKVVCREDPAGFLQLSPAVMTDLLNQNHLAAPEKAIFDAVARWAEDVAGQLLDSYTDLSSLSPRVLSVSAASPCNITPLAAEQATAAALLAVPGAEVDAAQINTAVEAAAVAAAGPQLPQECTAAALDSSTSPLTASSTMSVATAPIPAPTAAPAQAAQGPAAPTAAPAPAPVPLGMSSSPFAAFSATVSGPSLPILSSAPSQYASAAQAAQPLAGISAVARQPQQQHSQWQMFQSLSSFNLDEKTDASIAQVFLQIRYPLMSLEDLEQVKQHHLVQSHLAVLALVEEALAHTASVLGLPTAAAASKASMFAVENKRLLRSADDARSCVRYQRRRLPFYHELLYVCDGDQNGILRFIGTRYGTQEWVNPVLAKWVDVRASSPPAARCTDPKALVGDKFLSTNFAGPRFVEGQPVTWWSIDLGEGHQLLVNFYTLRHDGSNAFVRSWVLQGSSDGQAWVDIHRHQNDSSIKRAGQYASWPVNGAAASVPYRAFRLLLTGPTASPTEPHHFHLSYVELYGYLYCCSSRTDASFPEASAITSSAPGDAAALDGRPDAAAATAAAAMFCMGSGAAGNGCGASGGGSSAAAGLSMSRSPSISAA